MPRPWSRMPVSYTHLEVYKRQGQSGGPTSGINSSLAGVYESCKRRGAGKVYGMMHGVAGLLERRVCVLDDKLKSAMDIEPVSYTHLSLMPC